MYAYTDAPNTHALALFCPTFQQLKPACYAVRSVDRDEKKLYFLFHFLYIF